MSRTYRNRHNRGSMWWNGSMWNNSDLSYDDPWIIKIKSKQHRDGFLRQKFCKYMKEHSVSRRRCNEKEYHNNVKNDIERSYEIVEPFDKDLKHFWWVYD